MSEIFDINGIQLSVSREHRFGTDALLLGEFLTPHKQDVACDLCTGCGIIPVLLSQKEFAPKRIYAVDIAEEAVRLLRETVSRNKLDTIIPLSEDLKSISTIPRESVDLVSANPPYFKQDSGKLKLADAESVARHELLCNIDDVVRSAKRLLKYGGTLCICHIPERLVDVLSTMRHHGIEPKQLIFVSGEGKSEPWLFLVRGKKGGKAGMTVSYYVKKD